MSSRVAWGWLMAISLCFIWLSPSKAGVLRVAKDGTGDFTVLQLAADVAAPGDTILVASGRYAESSIYPYDGPGFVGETYLGIGVSNLTIIGEDRDQVIIGPEELVISGFDPKGIAMQYQVATDLTLMNLTIENVREGTRLHENATVENCVIRNCDFGVFAFGDSVRVLNSEIRDCLSGGILTFGLDSALVSGCTLTDNGSIHIDFEFTTNAKVVACDLSGAARAGIQAAQFSSVDIQSCSIVDAEVWGVRVSFDSTASINSVTAMAGRGGLSLTASCHVAGANNIVEGSSYAMRFGNMATSAIHRSEIRGQVILDSYASLTTVDLTRNYWGTTDPDSVAALITDINDDPTNLGIVEFEPLLSSPVPTRKQSMGDIKRLFGLDRN